MTHPGRWEIGGGVGVTLLASLEQVFFDDSRLGVLGCANVVNAVAIIANGFVGGLPWRFFDEEFDRCAVKVGDVRVEHVRRNIVSLHFGFVGVTLGAQIDGG